MKTSEVTGSGLTEEEQLPVPTKKVVPTVVTKPQIQKPIVNTKQVSAPIIEKPKKKVYTVKFDTKTQFPFEVKFSERGFLIGDTRLSFELLETADSKNFNIVLDNGKGIVLDGVKIQKILKYKDRF